MYISRVQGAPCGEAKVQLYKGANGPEAKKLLNKRQMLLKMEKDSKKEWKVEKDSKKTSQVDKKLCQLQLSK